MHIGNNFYHLKILTYIKNYLMHYSKMQFILIVSYTIKATPIDQHYSNIQGENRFNINDVGIKTY